MHTNTSTEWPGLAGLLVGFTGLIVGVLVAHRTPAAGYELSIYGATPLLFWVGVVLALLGSVLALVISESRRTAEFGYLLVYLAVLAVLALPLLRGYHFFGGGDSLSHLGFTRDIAGGELSAERFLYPGVHTTALVWHRTTGVALTQAFQAVVLLFFLVHLVFVPLCVRAISDSRWALVTGVLAAALLLPLNHISVHPVVHPSSQAILFTPVVLFLLLRYTVGDGDRLSGPVSGYGVLLTLGGLAAVLFHPQQALNIVVLLGTITGVQLLARRYDWQPVADHRLLGLHTAGLGLAWLIWSARHERVGDSIGGVLSGLLAAGSGAGDEVAQRSGSLAQVGGSVPELFAKLFLVSTLFIGLVGLLVLVRLRGGADRTDATGLRDYLMIALVPLGGLFAVFLVASVTTQYFRYLGFLMVLVAILGAVALVEGSAWLGERSSAGTARLVLAGVLACFLVLQLPVMFTSPYIYQGNSQVTEMKMDGYATAFEARVPDQPFAGVRGGPGRYVDAHYGSTSEASATFPGKDSVVPPPVFNSNTSTHYDSPRYIVATRSTYLREVSLYRGFRYSEGGFRALRTDPGVDRVVSNGEFRLYQVGTEPRPTGGARTANDSTTGGSTAGPDDATPTPSSPTPTATPTGTPTGTPTPTPGVVVELPPENGTTTPPGDTATPSGTATATGTAVPEPTESPVVTPPAASPTPTAAPTADGTPTPATARTPTGTSTATRTATSTPTATPDGPVTDLVPGLLDGSGSTPTPTPTPEDSLFDGISTTATPTSDTNRTATPRPTPTATP